MEIVALVLLGAAWGGSFLFMRIAAPLIGPVNLIQWRLIFATLVLIPFARGDRKKLHRNDYFHFFVIGVLHCALPFSLLAYASVHLNAGFASIMNATAPFFSVLWGALFFQHKLHARQNWGLALGFVGVWVLVSDKLSFKGGLSVEMLPLLAGLLAGACYGFAGNYSKKYAAHIQPRRLTFWNCFFAALALLPLCYSGPYPWNFPAKVMLSALCLGIICTAFAFLLYFKLIARSGATKALMVTFLIPVFACLWGWLFLSEAITLKMTLGAAIVFGGIVVLMKKPKMENLPL